MPASRTPILVDATGHRRRAVRGLTFVGTLALGGLLLAVPLSLLAPEHLSHRSEAGASSTTGLRGTVFVDHDCDDRRSAADRGVPELRIVLIKAGLGPVATTRSDATGRFAFANIAAGVDYDVQVPTGDPDAPTTLYTEMPVTPTDVLDIAQRPTGSCTASS